MKTFRCWAPDLETENEARRYEADSWVDAAEKFAAWSHREEEFEELRIHVRCDDGSLYSVDVEAEMELSFYLGMKQKLEDKKSDTEAQP